MLIMIPPANNTTAQKQSGSNYLLMVAYKAKNPLPEPDKERRCRFDMFIRLRPGIPSPFRDQQRTFCFRGDKYTDIEHKMLRNLLNLVKNKIHLYDRVELYDNSKGICEERIVLKITEDVVAENRLNHYSLMLHNYALPHWLTT